jgi:hypothetical protein
MPNDNFQKEERPSPVTRSQFEAEIIAKAWQDPEYKKRLLAAPKEVLQEELRKIRPGAKLPEKMQIYVHEETPNVVHISLPANPQEHSGTLSEEYLDEVAGGCIAVAVAVVYGVAVTAQIVANVSAAGNVNVTANVNANVNVNVSVNKTS